MGLFGSLYVGSSGLQSSQNALNTTAHNLANRDTRGYTRQQVVFTDRDYVTLSKNANSISRQQTGLGVEFSKVRQVRDGFLDKTFRRESGRSAFYEVNAVTLDEVHSQLGELNGESFADALDEMWVAVQEMTKNPDSVSKGLLVHKASAFIERAAAVYQGLSEYQDNLNLQVKQQVDQINVYGKRLKELNKEILSIEVGKTETPNDLRDERNNILDELSKMVNMTYKENTDGTVSVKIEGMDFVQRTVSYEIGLDQDNTTGFYTPFWKQNATFTLDADGNKVYNIKDAKVFDMTQSIESSNNTVGGLKAMIMARGDHRADYRDLNKNTYDSSGVSQSLIMNVQAEFDQLIHIMTTKINDIIRDAADPSIGYLCGDDGNPLELFTRIGTDTYDSSGNYNNPDPTKSETLYSVTNLKINPELSKEPSKLDFFKPDGLGSTDGKMDMETLNKLKTAFQEKKYTLNPNLETPCSFTDYYSGLVSQVGTTGAVNLELYNNQQRTADAFDGARQQVAGVSQDEELSNMIRFQNAYNASSRYINVVSEMMEHLLQKLG